MTIFTLYQLTQSLFLTQVFAWVVIWAKLKVLIATACQFYIEYMDFRVG